MNYFGEMVRSSMKSVDLSPVYDGYISSVGNGGSSISVYDEADELRGLVNIAPYGFFSSPPPELKGFIYRSKDDSPDGVFGVYDPNRPNNIQGGDSGIYSSSGAMVVARASGVVDIATSNGKALLINGTPLGDVVGVTESRVIELIGEYGGGIDEEELQEYLDEHHYNNETTIRGWITQANIQLGTELRSEMASNYVTLSSYNQKMNTLVKAITNIDDDWQETISDEEEFRRSLGHIVIDSEEMRRTLEGVEIGLTFFTGASVPTLTNYPADGWETAQEKQQHVNAIYLVNDYGGTEAGHYYIFVYEDNTYKWRRMRQQELDDLGGEIEAISTSLVTNYYNISTIDSKFEQTEEDITLAISSYDDTVQSQFTQVESTITGVQTSLQQYHEETVAIDTRLTVAEGEISTKVSLEEFEETLDNEIGTVETHIGQVSSSLTQTASAIRSEVEQRFTDLKVGGRNLFHNSATLIYTDYRFD